MTQLSNLYAANIFAEHPISLYTLDDDVNYISLITDEQRLFGSGGWSAVSASTTFNDNPTLPDIVSPFDSDIYSEIIYNTPSASAAAFNIEIQSPVLFKLNDLNEELATFSISMYLYQNSFYVNWYEVGYVYYDQITEQDVEVVTKVQANEGREWINFDFSYLPHDYDSSEIRIIIRINAEGGGQQEDYRFIVNGITIGQWSEAFSSQHPGIIPQSSPVSASGYPAIEYGIQENSGYYLIENNNLIAKNQGLPLVYGSKSSTKIYPSENPGSPSIVFPGDGFLNNKGKQNEYTFEFWMNIKPNTDKERRIFGPISSQDGIYVKNGFISLVIGGELGSHYISEWYRPMIIHVSLASDTASLLINGEIVVTIPFNRSDVIFPADNDWIGFYSYDDIEFFSIDCVSVYPYIIPTDVAKRRFVYGQGTDSPDFVASSFDGSNSYINFSNAKYGVNKIYPDLAPWNAGNSDNLFITRNSISVPQYELPEIFIEGRNVQNLYEDNKIVNELQGDSFFTFRPNISNNNFVSNGLKWNEPGYIYFDSLQFVDNLSAIYGVFSTTDPNTKQPLMTITNSINNDKLEVYIENKTIYYKFNNDLLTTKSLYDDIDEGYNYNYGVQTTGENENNSSIDYFYDYDGDYLWQYSFAFGFNITKFSQSFGYRVKKFFQSPNNLQAYFAGDGTSTFTQKIHSIGFVNSLNLNEISSYFLEDGVVDNFEYENIVNHTATYTLVPLIRYGHFFLDISVSALWEEYFPLSSFASYVDNYEGERYLDLDFLQINLGYPSVTEVIEKVINQFGWNYAELFLKFNSPVQENYETLGIPSISGYETYEDLTTNNIIESFLNTEKSSLRAYLTFQLLSDGSSRPLKDFPYTRDPFATKFINPDLEATVSSPNKAYLTKFEFTDKTIVFPPSAIDFNDVAIVFHFVIKQEGILSNPLVVRDFEIVSRSLNHNQFTAIGSESGFPFYSYVKDGIYYENKTQNPVLISKKRYPYLYLTEDAGLATLGKQTKEKEYGIAMPINDKQSDDYLVSAMQSWIKYNFRDFSSITYPIFEIQSRDKTIEFVIKTDASGKRGVVSARNKSTRVIEENVTYYQNGKRVKNPIIESNEWTAIGILFDEELIFNNYTGYINFFRGINFNNVSHYKPSGLGKTLEIIPRQWRKVLESDSVDYFRWSAWYVKDNTVTKTRTNLAYNPNFELDSSGWAALGSGTTIEIVDDGKFNDKGLKCTTATDDNSGVIFADVSGQRIPVSPSTGYTCSVYVKIPDGYGSKTLRMSINEYSDVSGGSLINTVDFNSAEISFENGWSRLFCPVVTDPTTQAISFKIVQEENNIDGSVFYVSNALVEDTTNIFPRLNRYFDGGYSSPGLLAEDNFWNGAENSSTSTVVYFAPQENDIRQWESVYALTSDTFFSLNPGDIYKAFIGTNGVIVDDGTSISIDSDVLRVVSSVGWLRFSETPA